MASGMNYAMTQNNEMPFKSSEPSHGHEAGGNNFI
jgi:hypothetical protein